MHQNTPLAFPGGRTASTSLPSSNQPTYADTLSSAVTSNKTKMEDQRSQVDQTRHARPTTDARTAAPTPQSNSTPGLPQKRHLAVQRIPKKTQRRERANVPFLVSSLLHFLYLRSGATTNDGTNVVTGGTITVEGEGIIPTPRKRRQRAKETIPHP